MKHLFTRFLMISASAIALMAYANASMASVVVDGINYDLNKGSKTAKVVKSPEKYAGDVVIPETIAYGDVTYTVNRIDSCAFIDCADLTSITIGDKVQTIGYSAFERCYSLRQVNFGSKLWFIDYESFKHCTSLQGVILPKSVTYLANEAFYGCANLLSVSLNSKLSYIGKKAFAGTNIFSLNIPASVKTLDWNFIDEPWLRQVITTPMKPLAVMPETFQGVNQPACVLYVPFDAMDAYEAADYWKEFGEILLIIEDDIFGVVIDGICYNLNTVTRCAEVVGAVNTAMVEIPEEVSYEGESYLVHAINSNAFAGCDKLETLTIPAGVKYLGYNAFNGCTSLKVVYNYSEFIYTEDNSFDGSNYTNATLWVLESELAKYKSVEPWSNFKEILSFTTTGISEVSAASAAEYYDVNGRKIETLQKGVNIIKDGDKTSKVIVK